MPSSHGFDAAALFQRDPDTLPRVRPLARRHAHALDAEPDHAGALEHLEHARNHIESVQAGSSDFDPKRLAGYLKGAMDCLQGGAKDADPDDMTSEERHRAATGEDDVGETEARSVVTPASREVDHRKDFNSNRQGGADHALAFDTDALLQR